MGNVRQGEIVVLNRFDALRLVEELQEATVVLHTRGHRELAESLRSWAEKLTEASSIELVEIPATDNLLSELWVG